MIGGRKQMAWYEIVIYPILVVFGGTFIMRMMGKRAAGEVTLMDMIVVIIMANVLSQPIFSRSIVETAFTVIMLFISHYVISFLQLNNKWAKFATTQPVVLVRHGNIDEKNLRKARISITQLLGDLRVKGYPRLQDVEFAIMEEMGRMSVIPKSSYRSVTPNDLQIVPPYEGIPALVVKDGKIIDDNLERIGRDRQYLIDQLRMKGYSEHAIKYLSLVAVDINGQIQVDLNDDLSQGKVEGRYQNLFNQGLTEMQKQAKTPEQPDYEVVDDYLEPK
jgi:uncharacterized membrane protein YcaP (DUF421 family)